MYASPAEDAVPDFTPKGVQYRVVTDGFDPLDGRPLFAGKSYGSVYRLADDWARELTPEEAAYLTVPPKSSPRDAVGKPLNIHDQLSMLRLFAAGQTYRPENLPPGVAEP